MSWPGSLGTEIFRCLHDACAEELLPVPVHNDTRREWMIGCNEPFRESQPVVGDACGERRERGGNTPINSFGLLVVRTPDQDESIAWLRQIGADQRCRNGRVEIFQLLVCVRDFGLQGGER